MSAMQIDSIYSLRWAQLSVTCDLRLDESNLVSTNNIAEVAKLDKNSVYAFNAAILKEVMQLTEVKKVHYWSDDPSSQFKNRFNMANLLCHPQDFNCEATWSFFETAHGKGACDGVGAEVKRSVWRSILQGNAVVTSAEEFFDTAKSLSKNINILYVPQGEIQEVEGKLLERYERSKAIPKTHTVHFVQRSTDTHVSVSKNSQFLKTDECHEHALLLEQTKPHASSEATQQIPGILEENATHKNTSKVKPSSPPNIHLQVQYGLPQDLASTLSKVSQFSFPAPKSALISAIVEGRVRFKGKGIINQEDLKSLYGGQVKAEDNYLTNFVIDSYLEIVSKSGADGIQVEVIKWEIFEKCTPSLHTKNPILLKKEAFESRYNNITMFLSQASIANDIVISSGLDRSPFHIASFWIITDLHEDDLYNVNGTAHSCHITNASLKSNLKPLGHFGSHNCDSPASLVHSSLDAMKEFHPDPDFILWLGDSLSHAFNNNPSLKKEAAYSFIGRILQKIRKRFPQVPIYPALGNHDNKPSQLMPVNDESFYAAYLNNSDWNTLFTNERNTLFTNETKRTFLKGGYYCTYIKPGLKLITLNTILWLDANNLTKNMSDPADQFQWLKKHRKGDANLKKIKLRTPGMTSMNSVDAQLKEYTTKVIGYLDNRYGVENNRELVEFFGSLLSAEERNAAISQWPALNTKISRRQEAKLLDVYSSLLQSRPDDVCSCLALVEIMLSLSPSTATCQRGFSAMNKLKTDRKTRMGQKTLDSLLRILHMQSSAADICPGPAIEYFLSKGSRHMQSSAADICPGPAIEYFLSKGSRHIRIIPQAQQSTKKI
ncbi:Acid sphingomyelinase-like phosphodiesterase 3b [Nymphon striatum]|nr:Acid sphingomyelinase-like phosphodiesterase 3b [Nymphon striatum]